MDGFGLALIGMTLIGGIGMLRWRRHRKQQLPLTSQTVRCPSHDCQADVSVRTDPRAHSHRRYVDVTACSLLSDAAVALPEHSAYLPDSPPYKVRLEAARSYPVYATEVSCPQPCVFVLNAAAPSVAPRPLECTSGTADGIDLNRQVAGHPAGYPLLWYSSL